MSSRSTGLQTEVSKKTPALPPKRSASAARSAMPPCAMISCALGVGLDEAREVVGDRRQPAAAVDQDRNAALGGELEDRRQPLVVQEEALRARMELDPAGAEIEAAHRLLDRLLAQVEPDEGDEPSVRALRELERAVVRRAESRMPVRLVHAEHEAARDRRSGRRCP